MESERSHTMLDLFDLAPKDRMIAQLLQSQGLITAAQLRLALARSTESLFFSLAEVLIGDGMVTLERLEAILHDYFKKLRLGELALARGLITDQQLELALSVQEANQSRIGEIFVELNIATPEQISMLVDFQNRCRVEAAAF